MKAIKLTPTQRQVFELLKKTHGGKIRRHIRPSNTVCFRLLDKNMNPLMNIRYHIVQELIEKEVITIQDHDYILTATSAVV
jgi:hypothetical protein